MLLVQVALAKVAAISTGKGQFAPRVWARASPAGSRVAVPPPVARTAASRPLRIPAGRGSRPGQRGFGTFRSRGQNRPRGARVVAIPGREREGAVGDQECCFIARGGVR